LQIIKAVIAKDGLNGFFRGLGPALVLVINPVLQYTVFEQLKNFLIKRRTLKLRAGGSGNAVAILSDRDFFVLGALSKLGALSEIRV
jgi:adenine nucleotide transporter 17